MNLFLDVDAAGGQLAVTIAVAIYELQTQAENAVKALQRAGFDMKQISIIGKDYQTEEHFIGFLNASGRARIFGKYGAFWGCYAVDVKSSKL